MNSKEYGKILDRLPIKNPTPEDMATMCPHLTEEQAVAAFNSDSGYVACPPLRIRGSFQIVSFYKGSDKHPPNLSWSYASRTPQSYADGKSHGDVFCEYQHMTEAMKFAEDNWGDELILDTWESVMTIYIQDPSELTSTVFSKKQPKTKAVLFVTLSRDLNKIINDHSRPESELFDEAIVEMTLDAKIWHELKGGHGGCTEFNCAYCGHGLGLSECSGCGHKFDDDGFRSGPPAPLSKKMVEFLQQSGHIFKQDPKIVWDRERQEHEEYLETVKKRVQQKL